MFSAQKRNALLVAAIFTAIAGVLFLLPRQHAPVSDVSPEQPEQQDADGAHFAKMRSSHRQTPQELEAHNRIESWRDALTAADRCAAFAKVITDGATAHLAMQWGAGIEDEPTRNMAVESISCAWAKCDPRAAAGWALKFNGDAIARSAAITTVFTSWAAQDAKAASAYAVTLGQADQTYAIAAVAPALAANNPNDAIAWAQALNEEDARNLATHYVVNTWSDGAPTEAAAWALTQPEGFDRADDVRTIVQKWLQTDAAAAVEWVSKLPAGASRDSAIDLISSQFTDSNPSFAANWAQAIDRPELRDARLKALSEKTPNTTPQQPISAEQGAR